MVLQNTKVTGYLEFFWDKIHMTWRYDWYDQRSIMIWPLTLVFFASQNIWLFFGYSFFNQWNWLHTMSNFCWLTNVDCWHFNLWRFYSILDSFSWIVIKWKFIFIWSLFSVILRTWTFPSLNSDRRIAALKKTLVTVTISWLD